MNLLDLTDCNCASALALQCSGAVAVHPQSETMHICIWNQCTAISSSIAENRAREAILEPFHTKQLSLRHFYIEKNMLNKQTHANKTFIQTYRRLIVASYPTTCRRKQGDLLRTHRDNGRRWKPCISIGVMPSILGILFWRLHLNTLITVFKLCLDNAQFAL